MAAVALLVVQGRHACLPLRHWQVGLGKSGRGQWRSKYMGIKVAHAMGAMWWHLPLLSLKSCEAAKALGVYEVVNHVILMQDAEGAHVKSLISF